MEALLGRYWDASKISFGASSEIQQMHGTLWPFRGADLSNLGV